MFAWTVLVIAIVGALAMWARQSSIGLAVFLTAAALTVGGTIVHRLVTGRWIGESS